MRRSFFFRLIPALFVVASLGSVSRLHASEAAGEKVAFTVEDVCSASGCTIAYDVYAKGSRAYVRTRYVKHTNWLKKKPGSVSYEIVDFGKGTILALDPKKRTATAHKIARPLPLERMINELLRAQNARAFLGKRSQHGTILTFQTITSTVKKAQKAADFNEAVLSVPKGYRMVKGP